jgi:hypothetical protein
MTYDEEFARGSPGVALTLALSEALLAERELTHFDSGARPDHPSMNSLWRERLKVAGCVIAPRATPKTTFEIVRKATELVA